MHASVWWWGDGAWYSCSHSAMAPPEFLGPHSLCLTTLGHAPALPHADRYACGGGWMVAAYPRQSPHSEC